MYTTNFYNIANDGNLTQNQVTGNGSSATLAGTLGNNDAATIGVAGSLTARAGAAILFNSGLVENVDAFWQQNYLLHELLHAFGELDEAVFNDFVKYGLVKPSDSTTAAITRWISTDCRFTPNQ